MNSNKNQYKKIMPYVARNMMIKKLVTPAELPATKEVGYINVGVLTASGALPVPDAVVTVYHTYNDGEEHVLYHFITDESGRVPTMELPVEYEGIGQQTEYYYSTYNMRIQAANFYTVNILDVQVHPNVSTDYSINLIPVALDDTQNSPGQTIVIPEKPTNVPNVQV